MSQRAIEAAVPEGFRVLQDRLLRRRIGRRLLSPALLTQFLRFGDLLAMLVGALVVPLFRHETVKFVETETWLILGVALIATNAFSLAGLYEEGELRRTGRQIRKVISLWAASIALGLVVLFLSKVSSDVSRIWTLGWFLSTGLMLVAIRLGLAKAVSALRDAGFLLRRVLIVGHASHGQSTLERLQDDGDIQVLGYLETPIDRPLSPGQVDWLHDFIRRKRVEEVVVALPWSATARAASLLSKLRTHPVAVNFLPGMDGAVSAALPLRGLAWFGGFPALRLQERPLDERKYLLKSLEDRILGSLLLLAAAPLMALIALAVKLTSKGPVFFRQARVGFHGEQFRVFKFRSMYTDLCDREGQGFVAHTAKNDPRVTPLGRFLRKTSLDELPQLINVVLGDMSLVGPRPHAVAHDDHYSAVIDEYLRRHRVKPGITGWAQVNGARGEIEDLSQMEQRIRYDLEYIEKWSLTFDLWIMLRTAGLAAWDGKAY